MYKYMRAIKHIIIRISRAIKIKKSIKIIEKQGKEGKLNREKLIITRFFSEFVVRVYAYIKVIWNIVDLSVMKNIV